MTQHSLYAGTSGWAYSSWKPGFYPEKLAARKFLEYYATRLNTVEVNYTFRSLLKLEQLQGWLAATPPDFRFSFKAPQQITHLRRLRDCADLLAEFLESLKPVVKAGRQGAVLFQFPPNFRPQAKGKDKQLNHLALAAFLKDSRKQLRQSKCRVAVEFRDPGWFTEETFALLQKMGVALCHAESDALTTPQIATADFTYSRMRASNYTELQLISESKKLQGLCREGPAFVYFKHEDAPDGPLRAEKLLSYGSE
jgi:uncharacterized protein YecE (DUF72 family)